MIAARGNRLLALLLVAVLALAGVVFGAAGAATAAGDPDIDDLSVHVDFDLFGAVSDGVGVQVDVVDSATMLVIGTGTTDGNGDVDIVDVDETTMVGEYWVHAHGIPFGYTDGTIEANHTLAGWDPVSITGYADYVALSGTVRHGETGTGYAGIWVTAFDSVGNLYPSYVATPASGAYTILVPRGEEYVVLAETLDDSATEQWWDHAPYDFFAIGCGCAPGNIIDATGPGLPVPPAPYDFDLWNTDTTYLIEVLAAEYPVPAGIPGVTVDLFKKVGSGYTKVDSRTTNLDGLVDVFASGPGTYLLYYSMGGVYRTAVITFGTPNATTLATNGCSVDVGTLTPLPGSLNLQITAIGFASTTPAPCVGSPAAPAKPKPRVSTGSFGTPTTPTATPTPTPTPTSTPSPSPSPSQTSEPSPSPKPTADPQPTQNVFDLWWLWLLLLLIVALIVFFIVRAILRR